MTSDTKQRLCTVRHPGELIAEDLRRLDLSPDEVSLRCAVSPERLADLTRCRAYPNVKESARLGPVLGRGVHNLYRHAQAHRATRSDR